MVKITIPEQIKNIRQSLGLTQKELADKVSKIKPKTKLNRQKIADYETNRSRIAAEDWVKIQSLANKGQGETRP